MCRYPVYTYTVCCTLSWGRPNIVLGPPWGHTLKIANLQAHMSFVSGCPETKQIGNPWNRPHLLTAQNDFMEKYVNCNIIKDYNQQLKVK